MGYSRLMRADEPATLKPQCLPRRDATDHPAPQRAVVNAPVDALLAEFGSVVEATSAAVEIQQALAGRNVAFACQAAQAFPNRGEPRRCDRTRGWHHLWRRVNIVARMASLAEGGCV